MSLNATMSYPDSNVKKHAQIHADTRRHKKMKSVTRMNSTGVICRLDLQITYSGHMLPATGTIAALPETGVVNPGIIDCIV